MAHRFELNVFEAIIFLGVFQCITSIANDRTQVHEGTIPRNQSPYVNSERDFSWELLFSGSGQSHYEILRCADSNNCLFLEKHAYARCHGVL